MFNEKFDEEAKKLVDKYLAATKPQPIVYDRPKLLAELATTLMAAVIQSPPRAKPLNMDSINAVKIANEILSLAEGAKVLAHVTDEEELLNE